MRGRWCAEVLALSPGEDHRDKRSKTTWAEGDKQRMPGFPKQANNHKMTIIIAPTLRKPRLVLLGPVAPGAGEDGKTLLSTCLVALQLEDPVRRRHATTQEAYDNGYGQGASRGALTAAMLSPSHRRTALVSCLAASSRARPSGWSIGTSRHIPNGAIALTRTWSSRPCRTPSRARPPVHGRRGHAPCLGHHARVWGTRAWRALSLPPSRHAPPRMLPPWHAPLPLPRSPVSAHAAPQSGLVRRRSPLWPGADPGDLAARAGHGACHAWPRLRGGRGATSAGATRSLSGAEAAASLRHGAPRRQAVCPAPVPLRHLCLWRMGPTKGGAARTSAMLSYAEAPSGRRIWGALSSCGGRALAAGRASATASATSWFTASPAVVTRVAAAS